VTRSSEGSVETWRPLGNDDAYRELVERLPAVVYLAEPGAEGRWLYVSSQIVPLLGFTPREWVADQHLWARLLHPDDRDRVVEVEQAFARRTQISPGSVPPLRQEYRMRSRDGRTVWIQDDCFFVPRRDGEPGYLRGLLLDITQQKETELALREREERLERALDHARSVIEESGAVLSGLREAALNGVPRLERRMAEALELIDESKPTPE
jgi:PAS domain S-box-containing protein